MAGANGQCYACAEGGYAALSGQSTCTACAAGTFNSQSSASTASACQPCAAGEYSSSGAVGCSSCSTGTFSNSSRASTCMMCAQGFYQPLIGQTRCSACAAGTFSDTAGMSACAACPIGMYALNAGQSSCSPCAPMQLCSLGTATPIDASLVTAYANATASGTLQQNASSLLLSGQSLSRGLDQSSITAALVALQASGERSVQLIVMGVGIAALCVMITLWLLSLRFAAVQRFMVFMDIAFTRQHDTPLDEPMIRRKTSEGGFFTLLFAFASLLMILYLILAYLRYSLSVTESFSSGTIRTERVLFNGSVAFVGYGGSCTPVLMPRVSSSGLHGEFSFNSTFIEPTATCVIQWQCANCIVLQAQPTVNITLQEDSALAVMVVALTQVTALLAPSRRCAVDHYAAYIFCAVQQSRRNVVWLPHLQ
eukprot:TRINITY_DN5227_c0_g1_i3.p1 TRINITY_DN5227_c0_g1~~TRINITY_DN5227_c0_g1_i3.p1  ORF type:complete len:490 (+),score=73.76 TRINITY_DN5227_c0_g1_i3:201-1472(+)